MPVLRGKPADPGALLVRFAQDRGPAPSGLRRPQAPVRYLLQRPSQYRIVGQEAGQELGVDLGAGFNETVEQARTARNPEDLGL